MPLLSRSMPGNGQPCLCCAGLGLATLRLCFALPCLLMQCPAVAEQHESLPRDASPCRCFAMPCQAPRSRCAARPRASELCVAMPSRGQAHHCGASPMLRSARLCYALPLLGASALFDADHRRCYAHRCVALLCHCDAALCSSVRSLRRALLRSPISALLSPSLCCLLCR